MSNIKKLSTLPPAPPSPSYQYELYLGDCIGDYVISYDFNPGGNSSDAIPCRIQLIDFSNPPQTTGFCGNPSYNNKLQELGLTGVASTNGNGTITYTKNDPTIDKIFLIIDSPLLGSKWSFTLGCPVICDSDIDSDNNNQDEINCSQVIRLYGPTVIGCGEDFIGGGVRNLLDCSNIIRVFGPEGDSDYCLNCISNEITLNVSCGIDDSDSDNDSDNDSDINTTNVLFDKSSWASIGTGNHNTQYKNYLDLAADRWAQFIRIDPNLVSYTKNNLDLNEPIWNGIKLASEDSINAAYPPGNYPVVIESDSSSTYAASCNPVSVREMNRFAGDYAILPLNFKLKINDYYSDPTNPSALTSQEWINAMTHELGHALGIGIFWRPANNGDPNPVWSVLSNPVNNFLDGNIDSSGSIRSFNVFENAQKAYNDIVGDSSLTKIPLETSSNPLSENGHWNDQFRSDGGVNYPGLADEIMVADVTPNMTVSRLSIKVLVDFKSFQEINPGAQEASPDTINSQSVTISTSKVRCNCK